VLQFGLVVADLRSTPDQKSASSKNELLYPRVRLLKVASTMIEDITMYFQLPRIHLFFAVLIIILPRSLPSAEERSRVRMRRLKSNLERLNQLVGTAEGGSLQGPSGASKRDGGTATGPPEGQRVVDLGLVLQASVQELETLGARDIVRKMSDFFYLLFRLIFLYL
jgi:hypothetical protein